MCGIVGFINSNINTSEGINILNRMLTRIKYRGPDEYGAFIQNGIGLGSVRLSIVDLKTGQQPLTNEDGSKWITFNGEIFNYIELKLELEQLGHQFKTTSDTEVIIHAYEQFGVDCLNKFNGQFAFAIYDIKKQELFVARDRVGIRPLFYYSDNNQFVFASEIKSIFEFPHIKRQIDIRKLQDVFTFWSPLSPGTVFENIYELPPGSYIIRNATEFKIDKYWVLTFPIEGDCDKISFLDASEQFSTLLKDSVKLRLRADVPVAAYLSGGLDSTCTTSLIKEIDPGILNTFSIGFADAEFDETQYQNEVASYFNTNHYSIKCSNRDICDAFYDVVWHSEVPLLRTSPTPMMLLSKLVRENNIKVVLTGEGADEIFAGYNIFKEAKIRAFWAKDKKSKLRPLLLKKLYPYLQHIREASPALLKLFFGYKLEEVDSLLYSHLLRWNNTRKIQAHFSEDVKSGFIHEDFKAVEKLYENQLKGRSLLAKTQILESNVFMSGYLLSSQGDRMGMANSVEGRYPFLDYRLIEFASKLPDDFKLNGFEEKYIIKEAMKNRIPKSVVNRPKQAYRAPIAKVFLNGSSSDYVHEFLSESSIKDSGLFNTESVTYLRRKITMGTQYSEIDNMALTGILSTQILYHLFIKDFQPLRDNQMCNAVIRNH